MPHYFQIYIVSPEEEIFSGRAEKLFVSGVQGDLEVLYGHAPFLTKLKPGAVWVETAEGKEEVLYISGGILEVQPKETRLLADVAIRATDVDEAHAIEAKKRAEHILEGHSAEFDYSRAQSELLEAVAQLRALQKLREYQSK